MVTKYVREFTLVERTQILVNLVEFKGLSEVSTYLRSDLRQQLRFHVLIPSLHEEKILRLSQAQIAIHAERFFRKID